MDSGEVLDVIVEYFHYWYRNKDCQDVPDMDIPVELCLEIILATDFLGLDGTFSAWDAFRIACFTWDLT